MAHFSSAEYYSVRLRAPQSPQPSAPGPPGCFRGFWQLRIKLPWGCPGRFLCGHAFSALWVEAQSTTAEPGGEKLRSTGATTLRLPRPRHLHPPAGAPLAPARPHVHLHRGLKLHRRGEASPAWKGPRPGGAQGTEGSSSAGEPEKTPNPPSALSPGALSPHTHRSPQFLHKPDPKPSTSEEQGTGPGAAGV